MWNRLVKAHLEESPALRGKKPAGPKTRAVRTDDEVGRREDIEVSGPPFFGPFLALVLSIMRVRME